MAANRGNKHGRQFKKGNPGGPGRPKGYRAPSTIVKEWLTEHPEDAEAIVQVGVHAAKKGDFQFWKYLWDRLEGTPAQTVNGNLNMNVSITKVQRGDRQFKRT